MRGVSILRKAALAIVSSSCLLGGCAGSVGGGANGDEVPPSIAGGSPGQAAAPAAHPPAAGVTETPPPKPESRVVPPTGASSDPAKADPKVADPAGPNPKPADLPRPAPVCLPAGTNVTPGPLSRTFQTTCAGCHGNQGQGLGNIPPVPGKNDFAHFRDIVRGGRKETMPAFAAAYASDVDLFRDFVSLTKMPLKAPDGLGCDTGNAMNDAEVDAAIKVGLATWRQKDKDGAACASCHGIEPYDLAIGGYDEATILRRALLHITREEAFKVIDYVRALRTKHGLSMVDSLKFRPFQPGGVVLGKDDAPSDERDHLFGTSLAQAAPTLGGARIDSLAKAKQAKDELLALSPRTFPIAIPLPRWTEDKFRGPDHATLNDWIPDVPRLPVDAAAEAKLYALHDAYIASPTLENLLKIDDALDTLTRPGTTAKGGNDLFLSKYRSVLLAQHEFRMRALGSSWLKDAGAVTLPGGRNAPWHVGDLAQGTAASMMKIKDCRPESPDCNSMPKVTLDGMNPNTSFYEEFVNMKLPWFWVGWEFDHTLYFSGDRGHSVSNSVTSSEYFTGALYNLGGYYNHLTYMRLRKNLAIGFEKNGAPASDGVQRFASASAQNWGYFLAFGRGLNDNATPTAGERRALYVKLLGNGLRMTLYLVADEIERTGQVYEKAGLKEGVPGTFEPFFTKFDDAATLAADKALMDRVSSLIKNACDIAMSAKGTADACR